MIRYVLPLLLVLALSMPLAARADALSGQNLNFNYVASNRDGVGMVRAFDDGKRTVVQFVDLAQQRPMLTTLSGTTILYRSIGNYAVMGGIEQRFRVYSEGQMSIVSEIGLPPAESPTQRVADVTTQPLTVSAPKAAAVQASPPPAPGGMAGFHATGATPVPTRASTAVARAKPADTPTAPAQPDPKSAPLPTWTIHRGETLSAALSAWCKRAGWDPPQWTSPYNQTALASVAFRGTFTGAVQQLFQAYKAAGAGEAGYHPLRVQLYVDQHLLRVIPATTDQDAR